jgi:hypothetical protein
MNAEYHGAACPPGNQFARGRKPKTVAIVAKPTASHRDGDAELTEEAGLATREPDSECSANIATLDRQQRAVGKR